MVELLTRSLRFVVNVPAAEAKTCMGSGAPARRPSRTGAPIRVYVTGAPMQCAAVQGCDQRAAADAGGPVRG
jgi:hypothetical protein